jgi:hypothetical protein
MAGDWIKMRTTLVAERAVMIICDNTGLDEFGVIGRLHSVWAWAGEHTTDGVILDVTVMTIDRIARHKGFADAMIAAKWLEVIENGIKIPRWESYNSRAAKERAQAAKRQADKRWRDKNGERDGESSGDAESVTDVTDESRSASRTTVTSHDARGEEKRGDERREEKNSNRDRTDRPIGASSDQSPMGVPLSVEGNGKPTAAVPAKPRGEPLDTSDIDWDSVVQRAEKLARKVPPRTSADRRQWFKFSVLVEVSMFSEHWLFDAAEAVVSVRHHEKNMHAHLVAVLKSKAAEEGSSPELLLDIMRRIEIPAEVWKRNVMQVKK